MSSLIVDQIQGQVLSNEKIILSAVGMFIKHLSLLIPMENATGQGFIVSKPSMSKDVRARHSSVDRHSQSTKQLPEQLSVPSEAEKGLAASRKSNLVLKSSIYVYMDLITQRHKRLSTGKRPNAENELHKLPPSTQAYRAQNQPLCTQPSSSSQRSCWRKRRRALGCWARTAR